LVAALLGPWSACVAVSVALFIQALLFGDGGVLAFGANSFNMAFVSPFLGYFVFRFLKAQLGGGRGGWISLGAASYLGLNMAAFCAAVELGIQPSLARDAAGLPLYFPYPLAIAIPGMMLPHLLVAGLVEAFFTVSVFAFVSKVSPESIYVGAKTRTLRIYGILAGLVCLSPLGLLAQGSAWGEWGVEEIRDLTWGGQRLGFVPSGLARGPSLKSAFQNYAVPGMPAWAGYVMSAAAGIALMVIAFKLLGLLKGRAAAVRDP
jgi:cobalt/nickel transport system permease protein